MTNVYIVSEKLSCIGQLNGTLERLFAVEFCNDIISGLMNGINALVFDKHALGRPRSDYCHVQTVKKTTYQLGMN